MHITTVYSPILKAQEPTPSDALEVVRLLGRFKCFSWLFLYLLHFGQIGYIGTVPMAWKEPLGRKPVCRSWAKKYAPHHEL